MKKVSKMICLLALILACVFLLSGCNESDGDFILYFRDANNYKLYPVSASFDKETNLNAKIYAVYGKLFEKETSSKYLSPFPEGLTMKSATVVDGRLIINFSQTYYGYTTIEQTLLRASLVKTYTQFPEISSVLFKVEDQPLTLVDGTVLQAQTASDYIDLFDNGLNESVQKEITLYFATAEGKLRKTVRTVDVKPSAQVERVVLSLLLQGPLSSEEGVETIPQGVTMISVSTVNGCCYVNLTDSILKTNPTVLPELMIYSIVDSLTELRDVSSVQFLVNSSSNVSFQDTIDFSTPFSRNLDFAENLTSQTTP